MSHTVNYAPRGQDRSVVEMEAVEYVYSSNSSNPVCTYYGTSSGSYLPRPLDYFGALDGLVHSQKPFVEYCKG